MALLGERFHARVDRIALAQSLRVLVVVIAIPIALTYSGAHGAKTYVPIAVPLRWEGLAGLLALSSASAWLLNRLRMPNAFFFGPLAATIALTVNDLQLSSLPTTLTNPAQMLAGFGWAVGRLAGLSVPSMILAMAPGGIAEMCVTAKVLQLGVPLVTAAHVVRVLVLIVTTGPAFRVARALQVRVRKR